MSPWNPAMPENVKAAADKIVAGWKDGSYDVFTGEIKDQSGAVKVAKGVRMEDKDIAVDGLVRPGRAELKTSFSPREKVSPKATDEGFRSAAGWSLTRPLSDKEKLRGVGHEPKALTPPFQPISMMSAAPPSRVLAASTTCRWWVNRIGCARSPIAVSASSPAP